MVVVVVVVVEVTSVGFSSLEEVEGMWMSTGLRMTE